LKDNTHLPSTRELLTKSSTMGTTSLELREKEHGGGTMSRPARLKNTSQEAPKSRQFKR
jgi:hypothetical protein